jgi:hypothetical protein
MSKRTVILTGILIIILLLNYIFRDTFNVWALISTSLIYILIVKFIFDLGNGLSIRNIIAIIAVLQYLVGAVWGYAYDYYIPEGYTMSVDQNTYFLYVLPATLAYLIGLYLPLGKAKKKQTIPIEKSAYRKGVTLILLGFIFEFMPFLGFLGFLLSNLRYVGAFYILTSPERKKIYWIYLVFGYLFFEALSGAMFHELLLWGLFFVMIYYFINPKPFWYKFFVILFSFILIYLIQLVKPDYREIAWYSSSKNKFEVFINIAVSKISGDVPLFSKENIISTIPRINQGWIVSAVMAHIPHKAPFANGQTIKETVIASIFPRFLMPTKAIASGHSNMENYAGITLSTSTAMDVGQIGEAYANFGVGGGILTMFLLGLFFNGVLVFIKKKSQKYPDLIFWLPLLFLQVIKAETCISTIVNHLVKASLVTWVFFTPLLLRFLRKFKII